MLHLFFVLRFTKWNLTQLFALFDVIFYLLVLNNELRSTFIVFLKNGENLLHVVIAKKLKPNIFYVMIHVLPIQSTSSSNLLSSVELNKNYCKAPSPSPLWTKNEKK